MEKPLDIPMTDWILCNIFALSYAKKQGWFEDLQNYKDVSSDDRGFASFEQGLELAVVSYRFWTKNLGIRQGH